LTKQLCAIKVNKKSELNTVKFLDKNLLIMTSQLFKVHKDL